MMRLLIQHSAASQNRHTFPIKEKPVKNDRGKPPLRWITFLILIACVGFAIKPFVEVGPDGKLKLTKWRENKLTQALNDLDEAEQYALLVLRDGTYPCYSCPNNLTINLKAGQVWKYGFTTKSEKGRYQKSLESKNLLYFVQLEGSITACMKEEKRKIYYYALLPENIARTMPLIRPPGNKQDN